MIKNKQDIRKGVKSDVEEYYTATEVCSTIKISRATLSRYLKDKLITAIKVPGSGKGGALRFRQKDLDNFNKKCAYKPSIA